MVKKDNLHVIFSVGNTMYRKTLSLRRSLKIDKTKILMTNNSLMKVESTAEYF